ncbi:patatin-like phospholipase family protein [Amphibacillus sediminis]|uniref:patatin-like phospholipase family protein n=1 Tax=Amphibacillus sediminis TaxID=360185 RepID=UPI00082EDA50|nr:patatin-like phospholipase family protein [Amphibacillus sediminis]
MKIDGVFSGGGVKAFAYIGALEAVEQAGIKFERVAGSSAGALIAGLIAAGYQASELKQKVINLDLTDFLDGSKMERFLPFLKWLSLYHSLGLYKGKKFEGWLAQLLADKGIHTFSDLDKDKLKLTVADLTLKRLIIIPDDLEQVFGVAADRFSVAKAIRMSASLPYFFKPEKLYDQEAKKHLLVDGALLSSLPMWLYKRANQKLVRPVIGFQLQSKENYLMHTKSDNALQFTKTLITTMQHAQDLKYIAKYDQPNIVFLDTDEVNVADFGIDKQERLALIANGKKKTQVYLKKQFQ